MNRKILKRITLMLTIFAFILLLNVVQVHAANFDNGVSGTPITLLANKNIYCAQHGVEFWCDQCPDNKCMAGDHTVLYYSEISKINVTNKKLLEILHMPNDNKGFGNMEGHAKQNAIWSFLANYNTYEVQHIRNGLKKEDCEECMGRDTGHMNAVSDTWCQINIDKMVVNSKNKSIDITVSGVFENYKIYINGGEQYGGTYTSNSVSIPYDKFKGGTARVEVKASGTNLRATVWVLANSANLTSQRLIGIDTKKENVTVTDKAEINIYNVSLQKYITEINDVPLKDLYNSGDKNIVKNEMGQNLGATMTDREDKNATNMWQDVSGYDWLTNICASNGNTRSAKSVPSYLKYSQYNKVENPVYIEAGDTVTYEIYVYNNDKDDPAKEIQILDYLRDQNGNIPFTDFNFVTTTIEIQDIKNSTYVTKRFTSDRSSKDQKDLTFDLPEGATARITLKINFNIQFNVNDTERMIRNHVKFTKETEKNNVAEHTYRHEDADFVKMKKYEVSLEKYVSQVNYGPITEAEVASRRGKAEHQYDDNSLTNSWWKHNKVVTVKNGDYVTYTIILTNDSAETRIRVSKITDTLPPGVEFVSSSISHQSASGRTMVFVNPSRLELLDPGESVSFTVTVRVTEPNISLDILKNTATITELINKNNVSVKDSTPNNNTDSDYIQMVDIPIAGTVWNDRAFDKNSKIYDGIYDNSKEKPLKGIKVYLYRNGVTNPIATTTTNDNGNYEFRLNYIKGPKQSETINRWNGNYYSYYVVFEYDGITYTSTTFKDVTSYTENDSNAKEDNGKVKETRRSFNNRFSTINNEKGIVYTTKNENGYIPQSNHVYDNAAMQMQSSTSLITLSKNANLEKKLQHINLGLRGRDTFDLELSVDIYSTKVTVNGKSGVYNYDSNQVTVREEDIGVVEDAANVGNETRESSTTRVNQDIRETDIIHEKYENTGLGIEVTYELEIKNASETAGTASKIIDYYDSRYSFKEAYDEDNNILGTANGKNGEGYNSVVITTKGKTLTKDNNVMRIYVVYTLNDPIETLKVLLGEASVPEIPTYHMAEITEYKTFTTNNNEATRGLIDIDSAPGSANQEQVRTTETEKQNTATTGGNPTTVEYYFNKKLATNSGNDAYLTKLKYEDDTYTAPVLYFVSSDLQRKMNGVVFEDLTTVNHLKIKTGNGILEEGEKPVYGATVELVEQVGDGVVRYYTTTGTDGTFEFSNFLPGEYIIRYHYGDTTNTVLLNQAGEGINSKSYNGEDFQATNNAYEHKDENDNVITNLLNKTANFWYVYNEKEGISTATDNADRRKAVSDRVTAFIDEEMTVLNNMRNGKSEEASKVTYKDSQNTEKTVTVQDIIEATKMNAATQKLIITVEETIDLNKLENKDELIASKKVTVNPDEVLLAEWAIFPGKVNDYPEYRIENMNFGIAEVPVTTIDLQKHARAFNITDAAGTNVIASMSYENGEWQLNGDVIKPPLSDIIDVSIEDEKLQGARLQVTYEVMANMKTEINFDTNGLKVPKITGIVDYIDNDLSYNSSLGDNSKYWEITTYDDVSDAYSAQQWEDGTIPQGTVDPTGTLYTTIVKAKDGNPLLLEGEGTGIAYITLEKVLSSTDATLEEIITSTVESYEYSNIVEITNIDYNIEDGEEPQRDRVRRPNRYIILPGVQYDTATSETLVIHPPTGDSSVNITYYIVAVISLVILAVGAFGIKKFVLKK